MLKRDDFSKFTREEFDLLLKKAKSKGMSHQEAYNYVQDFCRKVKAPKFTSSAKTALTKDEFLQMFYRDIGASC